MWHSQILGSFEFSLLYGQNRPYVAHFWLKNNFSDLNTVGAPLFEAFLISKSVNLVYF